MNGYDHTPEPSFADKAVAVGKALTMIVWGGGIAVALLGFAALLIYAIFTA